MPKSVYRASALAVAARAIARIAATGLAVAAAAPVSDARAQILPDTAANRARGVVGCRQTSSGITCPGAPSGGGGGGGSSAYYNNMMGAYNTGVAIGNMMNQAFQAMERQAQIARMQQAISLNNQGIAAYNRGDFGSAAAAFQQAIGLSPNDPNMRGNLAEAHKRMAEQREAVERQRRQQMAEAKARIETMLGGLQSQLASERSTLNAGLGDATFVAPSGTSFFGLGGGQGAPPAPAKPGELAFVAPGDSLFSKGTQYSAPVDLRDTASDQFAAAQPIGAGAAAKPAETGGGLQFVAPDAKVVPTEPKETYTATVAAPGKRQVAPPVKPESVSTAALATLPARHGPTVSSVWPTPPGRPAPPPTRTAEALLGQIASQQTPVERLSREERTRLAEAIAEAREPGALSEQQYRELSVNAAKAAKAARDFAAEWRSRGWRDGGAVVVGMVAGAGAGAQVAAGAAQASGVPVAAQLGSAFSLGQSAGSLAYGAGDRFTHFMVTGAKATAMAEKAPEVRQLSDALLIRKFGLDIEYVSPRAIPKAPPASGAVMGLASIADATAAADKGASGLRKFRAGDEFGAATDLTSAGISGAKAGLEGIAALGGDKMQKALGPVGGIGQMWSGATAGTQVTIGLAEATENIKLGVLGRDVLVANAEKLERQSRLLFEKAHFVELARGKDGARIMKQLSAAR